MPKLSQGFFCTYMKKKLKKMPELVDLSGLSTTIVVDSNTVEPKKKVNTPYISSIDFHNKSVFVTNLEIGFKYTIKDLGSNEKVTFVANSNSEVLKCTNVSRSMIIIFIR